DGASDSGSSRRCAGPGDGRQTVVIAGITGPPGVGIRDMNKKRFVKCDVLIEALWMMAFPPAPAVVTPSSISPLFDMFLRNSRFKSSSSAPPRTFQEFSFLATATVFCLCVSIDV